MALGSGLASFGCCRPGRPTQGWEVWWDGGPCSSGMSCSFPWVWPPDSLWAPLPTRNKPLGLSGLVPVT